MKTRQYVYDIIFVLSAVILFVLAVMLPPVRSIADQGDFERVMRPCGLDFPADYSFYGWAYRFYRLSFTRADLLLYLPRLLFIVPSTSFIYPCAAARLICMPFGCFDMRVLAWIMFIWYTTVCVLILRRVQIENAVLRILFYAFFAAVFFNGVYLTFFNSLYGQSVMLASAATLALAFMKLYGDEGGSFRSRLIFFALASCLLTDSKLQCCVFAPFLASAAVYAAVKNKRFPLGIACAALIMWHGAGGYIINGGQLNTDTQYNSVFYGILRDSSDPAADLRALGIDEDMAADAGKHAYLDPSEYSFAPRTELTEEKFYSKMNNGKLIRFYITHPARFFSAMEATAKNAFEDKAGLGTFEKKYGYEEGRSSYRLELWQSVRAQLPKTLFFIIPLWCAYAVFAGILIKKHHPLGVPFALLMLMGAIQFPMPYMGNGAADISKQLFFFDLTADAGLCSVVYAAAVCADRHLRHVKKDM